MPGPPASGGALRPASGGPVRRPAPGRGVRAPVSLLLLATAVAFAAANTWFRDLEADTAAPLVGYATSSTVDVPHGTATIFLGLYTPRVFGLTVTPECTAALPIAALLGMAGVLGMTGRFPLVRILVALAGAAGAVFAVNQARIAMIGWAAHTWGAGGFGWAHATVGSVMIIAGVSAAIAGFFSVCGGRASRSARRRVGPTTPPLPVHAPARKER